MKPLLDPQGNPAPPPPPAYLVIPPAISAAAEAKLITAHVERCRALNLPVAFARLRPALASIQVWLPRGRRLTAAGVAELRRLAGRSARRKGWHVGGERVSWWCDVGDAESVLLAARDIFEEHSEEGIA